MFLALFLVCLAHDSLDVASKRRLLGHLRTRITIAEVSICRFYNSLLSSFRKRGRGRIDSHSSLVLFNIYVIWVFGCHCDQTLP